MSFVFKKFEVPSVTVRGSKKRFPVRRIYCVGRNYAEHTKEMGGDPKKDPPIFFSKPADTVLEHGAVMPYPLATENFHYEAELVVALSGGGSNISEADASKFIFGYAVGNDFTRRDLQAAAKQKGAPWDAAKGFDNSAAINAITMVRDAKLSNDSHIGLKVNSEFRQKATLGDMIWSVGEIIAELSKLYELQAGDLIYTGTPAGVGAVAPGDIVQASIEGLGLLKTTIGEPA
jgi:fumarylpyruvate hydrolase